VADKASRLLVDALKIYSPTMKEGKLAALIRRRMKSDFSYKDTEIDEAGNVVAEVGVGRRSVLLCGHMDTVPGRLPVVVEGGKVYGRGAVDAKSALCTMIVAGSRLRDAGMKVVVACVTREEGDSLGIQNIIKTSRRFDFAIFGEPGGSWKVTVGYRGRLGVRLAITTEGGHAGSPWAHASAFEASLSLLEIVRKYESEHQVGNDHFHSLSVSPTIIRSGSYHNVLPSRATLTLDVRIPAGMSCANVEREIRTIISRHADGTRSASFAVSFEEPTDPYEVDTGSSLVRAFQRAIILTTHQRPVMIRKTGTGDMNTLASQMGTSCVTYGPGEASLSHTKREAVDFSDYIKSIEVVTEAVRQLNTLAPA